MLYLQLRLLSTSAETACCVSVFPSMVQVGPLGDDMVAGRRPQQPRNHGRLQRQRRGRRRRRRRGRRLVPRVAHVLPLPLPNGAPAHAAPSRGDDRDLFLLLYVFLRLDGHDHGRGGRYARALLPLHREPRNSARSASGGCAAAAAGVRVCTVVVRVIHAPERPDFHGVMVPKSRVCHTAVERGGDDGRRPRRERALGLSADFRTLLGRGEIEL